MWHLRRQNISRQTVGRKFCLKQKDSVLKQKKQILVRFDLVTFDVPAYPLPPR